jgi:hypothetical protein
MVDPSPLANPFIDLYIKFSSEKKQIPLPVDLCSATDYGTIVLAHDLVTNPTAKNTSEIRPPLDMTNI